MEKRSNVAIYFLSLASFVTFLSAQLITPVLPVLANRLGAEDLSIATVSGIYIVLLALFQIFTGAFADRFGKRRTIALGASIAALSSISFTLAWSWEQLLILRGIAGIADAIAGPALLALVAETSGSQKGKAMGIFRSSQGLAFVVGPIIGGTTAHFFYLYAPFYVDFVLTILGIMIFLLLVREVERKPPKTSFSPMQALGSIKKNLTLMKTAYLGFSETFGFAALSSFLPALVIDFGMSEVEISLLFTMEAIAFTITNLIVGILSDRIGRKPIATMGLAFSSVTFIAFFFVKDFWQILLLMALYGFGSASVYLMSSAMAADIIGGETRATLFGAFDALMDLGLVAGPLVCLAFLSILNWSINSSFLLMAIFSIAAFGLIFHLKETKVS